MAKFHYFLKTDQGVVKLHFNGRGPEGLGGKRVEVRGTKAGDTVTAADGGVQALPSSTTTAAATSSTYNLAVVLFNFANDASKPWTPSEAAGAMFTNANSLAAFYKEQSFGTVTVTGDVFGWYTISADNSGCNYSTWAQQARSAAQAAGVSFGAYDNIAYVFPRAASCGWAGLAYTPGREFWLNGELGLRVAGHEFGHNLGAHHASSMSCKDSGGQATSISTSCSTSEYGDPFDVMGSAARHTNNWHKGQYAWLSGANMQTVTASGSYTLAPAETPSGSAQLLRIARGTTGDYYYLEFRQPFGFDSFSSSDPVVNGVSIRLAPDYPSIVQSRLIDTTPATASFGDAALTAGRTFTDPTYNISVTTESVSASGATVRVTLGGSTTPPPPPPPPPPSAVTAFPSSLTVSIGAVKDGDATRLKADDDSYLEINSASSSGQRTAWYGRFTGIPNGVTVLGVAYKGANSATCSQSVSLWNWTGGYWVTLDTRSVGVSEAEVAGAVSGTLADYVSGTSGTGDVAMMVRCTRTDTTSFYARADLMRLTYETSGTTPPPPPPPPPPASADLSLTIGDSPDPVTVGTNLTYTLTARNAGPDAASNVTVSDAIPAGMTLVSASASQGSCTGTTTVSCGLGSLAAGGTATVTLVVRPSTTGTPVNTASVSSSTADPASGNNSATATTTVAPGTAPPPTTSVTAFPSTTTIQTGSLRSGDATRLAADDNSYFQVNAASSYGMVASWYGRFTGVPNALAKLTVSYKGMSSAPCSQTVYLWNWTTAAWVALNSQSVGASEVLVTASASGTLADYVSGTSGTGDVALRVRCARGDYTAFYVSGDLMKIVYDKA